MEGERKEYKTVRIFEGAGTSWIEKIKGNGCIISNGHASVKKLAYGGDQRPDLTFVLWG